MVDFFALVGILMEADHLFERSASGLVTREMAWDAAWIGRRLRQLAG